jgi:hypothetical protein
MALCQFTDVRDDAQVVYVNPLQVFSVRWVEKESCTIITAASVDGEGRPLRVVVKEDVDDVVAALNKAMAR